MVQKANNTTEGGGRMGKFLSLRRSTHAASASTQCAAQDKSLASEPALASRGSTRKRTLVAREAHALLSDSSSDDGDGAKPVASGWLVRLHQMLTLGKDDVIEYDDGRLVIRDPDLLASEVRNAQPRLAGAG